MKKKICLLNFNSTIHRLWRDVIKRSVFNWSQTGSQRSHICKWWNKSWNLIFICVSFKRDFFLYWYKGSQVRDRYLDWFSYNTRAVIGQMNIGCQTLTSSFQLVWFWKPPEFLSWQCFAIGQTFLCSVFVDDCWVEIRFLSHNPQWGQCMWDTSVWLHLMLTPIRNLIMTSLHIMLFLYLSHVFDNVFWSLTFCEVKIPGILHFLGGGKWFHWTMSLSHLIVFLIFQNVLIFVYYHQKWCDFFQPIQKEILQFW